MLRFYNCILHIDICLPAPGFPLVQSVVQLIQDCVAMQPLRRPTAAQALQRLALTV